MSISVYLEQSDTNLAHWYIRHCVTQEVLHSEPSGRYWAYEACKDLGYSVAYELWPRPLGDRINPALQAQIDTGELIVCYKVEPIAVATRLNDEALITWWPDHLELSREGITQTQRPATEEAFEEILSRY